MKYLLDTNIFIMALTDDAALPDAARQIIESPENEKYVSAASIWEIVIKRAKRPEAMPIPGDVAVQCLREYGIRLLPINAEHALTVATLKTANNHEDPFDRLLIAQSKFENIPFITCDGNLDGYNEPTVQSLNKKRKKQKDN